jgi:hypothetical protein
VSEVRKLVSPARLRSGQLVPDGVGVFQQHGTAEPRPPGVPGDSLISCHPQ